MEIVYLGHSCFRLRGRDAAIVMDPYGPEVGVLAAVTADAVTVSHDHPGHNYVEAVRGARHVVRSPGEYEVSGAFLTGYLTYHDGQKGQVYGRSIAYLIEIDGVTICHLGDLGHVPTSSQVEELGAAQVLLIPVGGGATIDAAAAVETIGLLDPKIVVPMHYRIPDRRDDLQPVDGFLREMGLREVETQNRLTVTPTNLPLETQVVLLEQRGLSS